ncbi:MAG: T9SS type A sorting domain-containing protein [Candidatus Marinimicrobia bacterium]|nr:T9SS type A sorting domain-containing protein [Candidatus Neomarinimicrobiota bacterium]MCF7828207.1 T9SS type A sorting domain-containing protein [Candidatus Neomarinimicrobiota bacterium]MCF7879618.1 T9SS type A sorting domain-containing protein [Candidatus Neomarinimicrobiota bacterium]
MRKSFLYWGIYFLLIPAFMQAQQVAFPGAEGFGAYTTGGRGGSVYEVTNLNNSGPGSLREGVRMNNVTIVFRVSGYIDLQSTLEITGSNITIAGQTAPDDGICVRYYPTNIQGNNVIIRYMRFRLGDKNNLSSDAFNTNDRENIIIDHCSFSWGGDEVVSWYGNENMTVQYCMMGEGLDYNNHSMVGLWGGQTSYHHNLIYSSGTRHPKFAYTYNEDITDHRNNVIYNWDYQSAYCSPTGRVNIVNNYYKYGPATDSGVKNRIVYSEYDSKKLHVTGNFVYDYPNVTSDNWSEGVDGVPQKFDNPFPAPAVTTHTPEEALNIVLDHAGASIGRDAVDQRVVEEVQNGTGRSSTADSQSQLGGWPTLQADTAPTDSDHDGMPDNWESTEGLDPNDSSDRNLDPDSDGFTNLEEYLNSLVPVDYGTITEDTEPPVAPSNLEATTFSGDRIDLTWSDEADNERGFRIRYSDDNWNTQEEVTKAIANLTEASITGLDAETTYEFRIVAYNTKGESDTSNTASGTTLSADHYRVWTRSEGPGHLELDPAGGIYASGTEVTVTAVADSGYVFSSWLEYFEGVKNPETVTITTSIHIAAQFGEKNKAPTLYDFGPGPVEPGYMQVVASTQYTVSSGYGFTSTDGLDQRDRGDPDNILQDFVVAERRAEFKVDLNNNTYYITVRAGDQLSNAPNGPMDFYAEGEEVISGMSSDGGEFAAEQFSVDLVDEQLNLEMVHSNDEAGVWRINGLIISTTVPTVDEPGNMVTNFSLGQNFPNPFNPVTTIPYSINKQAHVLLTVYDISGREVAVLVNENQPSGRYTAKFDGSGLASGVYFYKLITPEKSVTKKFVLMR